MTATLQAPIADVAHEERQEAANLHATTVAEAELVARMNAMGGDVAAGRPLTEHRARIAALRQHLDELRAAQPHYAAAVAQAKAKRAAEIQAVRHGRIEALADQRLDLAAQIDTNVAELATLLAAQTAAVDEARDIHRDLGSVTAAGIPQQVTFGFRHYVADHLSSLVGELPQHAHPAYRDTTWRAAVANLLLDEER